MTYSEFITLAKRSEALEDIIISEDGKTISITVDDFIGFDESWNEVFRDLVDEDLVDRLVEGAKELGIKVFYTSEDI